MAQAASGALERAREGRGARRERVLDFSVFGLLLEQRGMGWALVAAPAVQVVLVMLGLGGWRCPFHAMTGLPCPGCGLSRAMGCLVRGDVMAAVRAHPFAPLLLVGWGVLGVGLMLPSRRRLALARWFDRVEERTRLVGLVVLAFVGFGLTRLVVAALAAYG